MKKFVSNILATVIIILICFSVAVTVSAEDTDMQKEASLTLVYKHGEVSYEGLDIKIYRIAEINKDASYDLVAPFDKYPVNIYGVQSQTEWELISHTLSSYAIADNIKPTSTKTTDGAGAVVFEKLLPGMYLTLGVQGEYGEETAVFDSFLTVVPSQNDDESLNYDVIAYPKCSKIMPNPNEISYKVIKQWKDDGNADNRPQSVKIDILKDGVLQETVTLSSENDWIYEWTASDDGSVWTTVEREIESEYSVNITKNGKTFIVTNIENDDGGDDDEDELPETGDTTPINLYIVLMCISGMILVIVFMGIKRKHYEET